MLIRRFLMLSFIASFTAFLNAENPAEGYFLGYLRGDTAMYTSDRRLKLSEVSDAAAEVWTAWRNANFRYEEEKLPALTPLSYGLKYAWQLPDSLEPDAEMPFFWGYKSDSVPSDNLPMFVYLHGSGPKEQEWSTGFRLAQRFEDSPSAYFVPQIPNEGEYYRWWQRSKQFAWNRLLRQALVSGHIDPDRIYMFGISEGGYGSQRLASFYADYLAAAGPMAGGEPLKNAPVENLRNTAFSLRTGDQDHGFYREKLTGRTRQALDSVSALDPGAYTYNVELIPGAGHGIDYLPTPPWLATHKRNPYPKKITWENFEMDNEYRDGFYNIYVNERSNKDTDTRTRYDLVIEDNHIDLTAQIVEYTATEIDPIWGIPLDFARRYTPATSGSVTIYLNDQLVDLSRPVTLTANGKTVFKGKVKLLYSNLVNSCAEFFDPARIYPAAIFVDFSE